MNLKNLKGIFTSKFAGTGPSSYEKKNLPGCGLTNVEKQWSNGIGLNSRGDVCKAFIVHNCHF